MDPRYLELQPATLAPGPHGGATLAEAAAATGLSVHALRRLVRAGRIEAEQIAGPRGPEYRIPRAAIASLAGRQRGAQGGAGRVTVAPRVVAATVTHGCPHCGQSARVAQLEEEVAFLRETIRDLRLLLLLARREETAQICAVTPLPASAIAVEQAMDERGGCRHVSPPRPAPSPRWRWWLPLRGLATEGQGLPARILQALGVG